MIKPMNIIIHKEYLSDSQIGQIQSELGGTVHYFDTMHPHYRLTNSVIKNIDLAQIRGLSDAMKIDINRIPDGFDGADCKLIISDMDSTLIAIECIDEIADFAGLKSEVAAITEQTMQGNIGFEQSFIKRIALLAGLSVSVLDRVFEERLSLSVGAADLVKKSQALGLKFALVSGGFDFFTERLRSQLKLDFAKANILDVLDDRLTGEVKSKVVDAGVKSKYLMSLCRQLSIEPTQVVAMGDGANDLEMMAVAGLSVAYRAKPIVAAEADVQINFGGLDVVLDFLYPIN